MVEITEQEAIIQQHRDETEQRDQQHADHIDALEQQIQELHEQIKSGVTAVLLQDLDCLTVPKNTTMVFRPKIPLTNDKLQYVARGLMKWARQRNINAIVIPHDFEVMTVTRNNPGFSAVDDDEVPADLA